MPVNAPTVSPAPSLRLAPADRFVATTHYAPAPRDSADLLSDRAQALADELAHAVPGRTERAAHGALRERVLGRLRIEFLCLADGVCSKVSHSEAPAVVVIRLLPGLF